MSAHLSIADLVPEYTRDPNPRGIFTKAWAVRTIVSGRLSSRNASGHGNAAKRRQLANIISMFPARRLFDEHGNLKAS